MLQFVGVKEKAEFNDERLDIRVHAITLLAAEYIYQKYGENIWVTSVQRDGDPGVHGNWRGVDADNDSGLAISEKEDVERYINKLFTYDPSRPKLKVCVYHEVKGRGGDHLHFQVHPNTVLNGGS